MVLIRGHFVTERKNWKGISKFSLEENGQDKGGGKQNGDSLHFREKFVPKIIFAKMSKRTAGTHAILEPR